MSGAEAERELTASTRGLANLHAQLERLQRQNDELADRLLESERAVAERILIAEEAAAAIDAREAELSEREARVEELRLEVERLAALPAARTQAGSESHRLAEIEELERRLAEVTGSQSWRLTAPLRALGRWVRRALGRAAR